MIPKSKVGVSKVLSPNKNINASYFHMGFGQSTPSILPFSMSYSFGMVRGVDIKEYYEGPFYDVGFGAVYGFDYCWVNPGARAYSMTIGNSYGIYGGYDYYWLLSNPTEK